MNVNLKHLTDFLLRFLLLTLISSCLLLVFAPAVTKAKVHEYLATFIVLFIFVHVVINKWFFKYLFAIKSTFLFGVIFSHCCFYSRLL